MVRHTGSFVETIRMILLVGCTVKEQYGSGTNGVMRFHNYTLNITVIDNMSVKHNVYRVFHDCRA